MAFALFFLVVPILALGAWACIMLASKMVSQPSSRLPLGFQPGVSERVRGGRHVYAPEGAANANQPHVLRRTHSPTVAEASLEDLLELGLLCLEDLAGRRGERVGKKAEDWIVHEGLRQAAPAWNPYLH